MGEKSWLLNLGYFDQNLKATLDRVQIIKNNFGLTSFFSKGVSLFGVLNIIPYISVEVSQQPKQLLHYQKNDMTKRKKEETRVGRLEVVHFPELELSDIRAKIDTGAYTSSIHCQDISIETMANGEAQVSFRLLDKKHPNFSDKIMKMPIIAQKKVRSSSGHARKRVIIKTPIQIGDIEVETELSLADRSKMEYPVLIGRKLLAKLNAVVDIKRTNILSKLTADGSSK